MMNSGKEDVRRKTSTPERKFICYPHGDRSPDRFTAELYHLAERARDNH